MRETVGVELQTASIAAVLAGLRETSEWQEHVYKD